MTSESNAVSRESSGQSHPESISSNKKIIKSGTSAAVTITKEADALGLQPGQEVLVRVSVPSFKTMVADQMANLYLSGDFYPCNRHIQLDFPANNSVVSCDEEEYHEIEEVSNLYESIMDTTNEFLHDYLKSNVFTLDSSLGSYTLFLCDTASLPNFNVDEDEKSIRQKLIKCLVGFKYVRLLLSDLNVSGSVFHVTKDPMQSLNAAISVCEKALTLHGDNLKAFIESENREWQIRQSMLLQTDGYYVVVKVLRGSLASYYDELSDDVIVMDVVHSYNREKLQSSLDDEMEKMSKRNTNGARYDFQIYGPFQENDAKQFKEYLSVGVKLNFKAYDPSGIFEWCGSQAEQYRQSRCRF